MSLNTEGEDFLAFARACEQKLGMSFKDIPVLRPSQLVQESFWRLEQCDNIALLRSECFWAEGNVHGLADIRQRICVPNCVEPGLIKRVREVGGAAKQLNTRGNGDVYFGRGWVIALPLPMRVETFEWKNPYPVDVREVIHRLDPTPCYASWEKVTLIRCNDLILAQIDSTGISRMSYVFRHELDDGRVLMYLEGGHFGSWMDIIIHNNPEFPDASVNTCGYQPYPQHMVARLDRGPFGDPRPHAIYVHGKCERINAPINGFCRSRDCRECCCRR